MIWTQLNLFKGLRFQMLAVIFQLRLHPRPQKEIKSSGRIEFIVNFCVNMFICQIKTFNVHHHVCTPDLAVLHFLVFWEPHKMKISEKF